MSTTLAELSELCLAHLVLEEATLRANREGLSQLHAAFLGGTLPELQACILHCQRLAEDTVAARTSREALCREIADHMELEPEEIRLSLLATWLPAPYGNRVSACRDKLHVLTEEVERLTKRVANVASYCKTFLQKAVEDSLGLPVLVHYGPVSRRVETRGTLLIANG